MPALIERHKMSLAMWAALKSHIMKQREKKKQEQEADAAVERLRREQEMKRKQHAMTLEEIREELAQLEKKLQDLRVEKHDMFLCLKRVLNEDDKRRNEEDKEPSELLQIGHHYANQNVPVGAPNLYMIGNSVVNRNAVMYKVGNAPTPQQNGTLKRPRSPSPPNSSYPQAYGYKTHVSAYGQNYPMHPAGQYTAQDQTKHLAAAYHVQHMQQSGYVSSLPQQIEHPGAKPNNMQDEKYYIQQTGGISTGYPIRSQPQPSSRFQPQTSHSVTAPLQVPVRKEDMMRRSMGNEAHR